ncbi:MAG TPA: hypothetical protein VEY33_11230 [Gemmatimonadota bacterium]|nr:hypothetical protein [Gemmatimonadota bacterium]
MPARAALFALLALGPACEDGSDLGPAGPALGSVRDGMASYDGLALEVHGWWLGWGIEPVPGPRLDALSFRVVNGAALPRAFDPRDVRIETADGVYWPRVLVGTEPELHPMTLAPLEDATGWIVFQVPADARLVAVVWIAAPGLALRIPLPAPSKSVG